MNNNINLPLFETVYRSFTYIVKNLKPFLKICSVFIVLWFIELMTDLPSLCSVDESYCRTDSLGKLIPIIHYIAATIVSVSVIRFIILKETTSWFQIRFGKNNIKFIAYNILIALMIIIPSALMIMIGGATHGNVSSRTAIQFLASLGAITFIGLGLYCFRLCLVYAGSAINDNSMTLSKSHSLTKGNILKIFIGQVLLVIPTILLVTIAYKIYTLTEWNYIGKSVFVLIGILLSFFDSAIKASYYSHMYQYFIYFSNKQTVAPLPQVKEETVAVTKTAPKKAVKKSSEIKKSAKKTTSKKTVAKKATTTKTTSKKTAEKSSAPTKKASTAKTTVKPKTKTTQAKKEKK